MIMVAEAIERRAKAPGLAIPQSVLARKRGDPASSTIILNNV
jgi:hypothetical protein